jgi:Gpi18-like mannosyltransferase
MISSTFIYSNVDPLAGCRAISILSSLLLILLTYLISIQIFKLSDMAFLGAGLLALNPGFVLWSYSGMETTFFTLFVTLGIFFTLKFLNVKENRYLIYSSIFFLIASLTRQEGVLLFPEFFVLDN